MSTRSLTVSNSSSAAIRLAPIHLATRSLISWSTGSPGLLRSDAASISAACLTVSNRRSRSLTAASRPAAAFLWARARARKGLPSAGLASGSSGPEVFRLAAARGAPGVTGGFRGDAGRARRRSRGGPLVAWGCCLAADGELGE